MPLENCPTERHVASWGKHMAVRVGTAEMGREVGVQESTVPIYFVPETTLADPRSLKP